MQQPAFGRLLRSLGVPILTGPFRPVQQAPAVTRPRSTRVPILTGPFRPVQLLGAPQGPKRRKFQSSPALSGQCNRHEAYRHEAGYIVPILTGPFRPVQRTFVTTTTGPPGNVPILTGPFRPVQRTDRTCPIPQPSGSNPHRPFQASATRRNNVQTVLRLLVPILTGPFRPVQRDVPCLAGQGFHVPILTGPFRPVQRASSYLPTSHLLSFQSSPALSGQCNDGRLITLSWICVFQSSPALSGQCNAVLGFEDCGKALVPILTGPFRPVQRRRGAKGGEGRRRFQSSPALSGQCNVVAPDIDAEY